MCSFPHAYYISIFKKIISQATREKADKLVFAEIKTLCPSKNPIKRVKRQPTEWEEIFSNHVSDKEYRCHTPTTLQQKNKQPDSKMGKEDIRLASKHMQRSSTSLSLGK